VTRRGGIASLLQSGVATNGPLFESTSKITPPLSGRRGQGVVGSEARSANHPHPLLS
jgi:hypothetical protein